MIILGVSVLVVVLVVGGLVWWVINGMINAS